MNETGAADEPPIDTSLNHYLEERALAIAHDKPAPPAQREQLARLMQLRAALMPQREAFLREATARRHARGEIYSRARVAAINAMGPTRQRLDDDVRALYARQPDAAGVLRAHAQTHFVHVLMSARLMLADTPPELVPAARTMQQREEAFAAAWLAAIGNPAFEAQVRRERREALRLLRTSTRAMLLATVPETVFGDEAAADLGKAWNRLDELARALGVEPLSTFLALPDEGAAAGVPAQRPLATVVALLEGVQSPGRKFPGKRAVAATLAALRDVLQPLAADGGKAWFEVDL